MNDHFNSLNTVVAMAMAKSSNREEGFPPDPSAVTTSVIQFMKDHNLLKEKEELK